MTPAEIDGLIHQSMAHHRAGRFPDAERGYRAAIAHRPNDPGLLNLLGMLAGDVGRSDAAVELFARAIALNRHNSDYHSNLGEHLRRLGRLDEAIAAFNSALAIKPDCLPSLNNLGMALGTKGDIAGAVAVFEAAVRSPAATAGTWANFANALIHLKKYDRAVFAARRAVQLQPGDPHGRLLLGIALGHQNHPEAESHLRAAIATDPARPEPWGALARLMERAGRHDDAEAAADRAIALAPDVVEHRNLKVHVLLDRRADHRAVDQSAADVGRFPGDVDLRRQLAEGLGRTGRLDDSIAELDRALAIDPTNADCRLDLANALLLKGDWDRGWREYEWRWNSPRFPKRTFQVPRWDGQPFPGKTLLVHAEQGMGDMIQFMRFVPQAVAVGGRVVFLGEPVVARLFRQIPGIEFIDRWQDVPPIDLHVPHMSLPLLFGVRPDTIPPVDPVLRADEYDINMWATRLGPRTGKRRIGLVWAGHGGHYNDFNRSIPLSKFGPLAGVDADFFSFQMGPPAGELKSAPFPIRDLTADIRDYADTAAALTQLDLVVSVDTSIVHLAGSMMKSAWLLLPFVPDWRWGLGRSDSAWYPTVRLFRQPRLYEWDEVSGTIAAELGTSS